MVWFGLEDEEYDRQYSDQNLVHRLATYLTPNRTRVIWAIIYLTISSMLTGLIPWLSSQLIAVLERQSGTGGSFWSSHTYFLLIWTFGFNILAWGLNYLSLYTSAHIVGDLLYSLQKDASRAVFNQDLAFFDKYPAGRVVSRVASDTQNFGEMAGLFIEAVSGLVVCIFTLIPLAISNLALS